MGDRGVAQLPLKQDGQPCEAGSERDIEGRVVADWLQHVRRVDDRAAEERPSDEDIAQFIFRPGFSTAEKISDVSGRGVGMDVVKRSVQALGGRISISSRPGQGSTFTLELPAEVKKDLVRQDEEIERIEAEGDYARIVTKDKSHLLRETVASLSERLDPALFLRIHRSYIVPIDRIRELRPQSNGDYRVHLVDGVQLPLSRTYREQVLSTLEHTRRRP